MEQNTIPKPNHKFFGLSPRQAFHVVHEVAKAEGVKRGLAMHWPTFKYWNALYHQNRKITHPESTNKRKRGRPRLNQPSDAQVSIGV